MLICTQALLTLNDPRGCNDRDSGPHNLVLRASDDGGKTFGLLTTIVHVSELWGPVGGRTPLATAFTPLSTEFTPEDPLM